MREEKWKREEIERICGIHPSRHDFLQKKTQNLTDQIEKKQLPRLVDTIGKIIVDDDLEVPEKVMVGCYIMSVVSESSRKRVDRVNDIIETIETMSEDPQIKDLKPGIAFYLGLKYGVQLEKKRRKGGEDK